MHFAPFSAQRCFQIWKHKPYAERAGILTKAAALPHAQVDDFGRLETLELDERIDEARGEVQFSGDILACYAQHAETFLAPVKLHPQQGEAHMESSPIGALIGSDAFIVLDDAFLARFKEALEALKPGDPMDEKTTLGPLSTEAAAPAGSCSPRSSPTSPPATRSSATSSSARRARCGRGTQRAACAWLAVSMPRCCSSTRSLFVAGAWPRRSEAKGATL